MSEGLLFVIVFVGLFILRAVAATIFFYYIIPQGDRCPNCDAVTLRMESKGWKVVAPHMRPSWCFECNWHGLLRPGELTPRETHQLSRTP